MTVIVYHAGVMAADTAVRGDSTVCTHTNKLFRMPDGGVLGCGGAPGYGAYFAAWLAEHVSLPLSALAAWTHLAISEAGFSALWARPDGTVWMFSQSTMPFEVTGPFHVVAGTALPVVVGALAMGATAVEAVAAAIRYSDGAAGDIKVMAVEPTRAKVSPTP